MPLNSKLYFNVQRSHLNGLKRMEKEKKTKKEENFFHYALFKYFVMLYDSTSFWTKIKILFKNCVFTRTENVHSILAIFFLLLQKKTISIQWECKKSSLKSKHKNKHFHHLNSTTSKVVIAIPSQIHQGWHFHYFQQGLDLCLTFFPVFRSNCVLLRAKLLFSGRIIGLRLLVLDQSSTYYSLIQGSR